MEARRPEVAHRDDRGTITDLLVDEPIEHVTLITSRQGAVRGNHYHKETTQWLYILEGRVQLLTQMPESPVQETVLEKGELIVNRPLERHAMLALEDSVILVFTCGPRGGQDYEQDTYRLAQPLARPGGSENAPSERGDSR